MKATTDDEKTAIKTQFMSILIQACSKTLPDNHPLICNWPTTTGLTPSCGENQTFDPCGGSQHEQICLCDIDFVLSNGDCVTLSELPAAGSGLWLDWMSWTNCENSLNGKRTRSRICGGMSFEIQKHSKIYHKIFSQKFNKNNF